MNMVEQVRVMMKDPLSNCSLSTDPIELLAQNLAIAKRVYWALDYREKFTGPAMSKSRNKWLRDILYVERCCVALDQMLTEMTVD